MPSLVVIHEHPEWQKPLFAALQRRGVDYAPFDLKRAAFDPDAVPAAPLYFNQASPSAYVRGNTRAVPLALSFMRALELGGARVLNGSRAFSLELAKSAQSALLKQLGIDHVFEDVFDIIAADFVAKPDEGAYMRFFEKLKIEPKRAAIFEDIVRNLVVPHARGMTTVLVLPAHDEGPERETWEIATGDEPHVDFVTDDLVEFLEGLSGA